MLVQTLYTMQIHLQRITVERRKILFRHEVFVMHHLYVVAINPFRNLGVAGHYQINVSYERHILLDTPEKIWQEAPVPEPFSRYGNFRMFCITLEPHRVQTVNVCITISIMAKLRIFYCNPNTMTLAKNSQYIKFSKIVICRQL